VALITGGATGIGAATAQLLRRSGYRVAIVGRDPNRLGRFAEQLGHPSDLLTLAGDSADYDSVRAAVDGTVD
jgi:NAD(P)-dependent dehydrogenase (short-subunit alcohol dehydrogenase family)